MYDLGTFALGLMLGLVLGLLLERYVLEPVAIARAELRARRRGR